MKGIHVYAWALCSLLCVPSMAQLNIPNHREAEEKPLLFKSLPPKINISTATMDRLFDEKASGYVRIDLAGNHHLEGTIVEKVKKSAILETINIRLLNFEGGLFTLSKIRSSEASVTYAGRVVSIAHGDVLILKREKNLFYLVRQKQSLYLVE